MYYGIDDYGATNGNFIHMVDEDPYSQARVIGYYPSQMTSF
jgi:hypothetical protein